MTLALDLMNLIGASEEQEAKGCCRCDMKQEMGRSEGVLGVVGVGREEEGLCSLEDGLKYH
jgi:hypothetical protein